MHQNLIEEVISVLAFASISKPVAKHLYIPAHLASLPEPTRCPAGTHLARREYRALLAPQQGALD
ncbi:hypothetical protein [Streptomyces zaomyceticus]|uniref:hypothetical protein n=1 Tax=Streptomyces zaomyceticus TaxID=68286 RepID=UPI002F911BFF